MSYYNGPKITTNGLIMHLDAANPKSYPGSGTTWYDLCGNYNATLVNSPTFSSDFCGVMNTSATGATRYAQITGINLSSGTYTIIGAARYTGAIKNRIISSSGTNWLLGHWSGYTDQHYANGWVYQGSADTSSNWFIYVGTGNTSADNWKFYINGIKRADNNLGSSGPNGLQIGGYAGGSEHSDGQCAFVIAYNRVFSDTEVLENYNTLRGRFRI